MKLKIDFCIIKNPWEKSSDSLSVFVTKSGLDHLDESTKDEEGYKIIVDALKKVGYLETDKFRFEYISNENAEDSNKSNLTELLQEAGANYSKTLEDSLNKDFETLQSNLDLDLINNMMKESDIEEFGSSIDEAFFKFQTDKTVQVSDENNDQDITLPRIGEEITLNLYLFVDLFINDDIENYKVDLSGSFSKESTESINGYYKSLIKIFTDSFKRVNYNKNSEIIELVSTKSKGDLYKEISFLYDVVIDVIKASRYNDQQTMLETNGYYFNILELKEKINLEEKIYFEVGVNDFKTMLGLSKNIAFEKETKQQNQVIEIDEVREECDEFIEVLEMDMIALAEDEEFKSAQELKEKVSKIKEKVENFEKEMSSSGRKKISIGEFHDFLSADV